MSDTTPIRRVVATAYGEPGDVVEIADAAAPEPQAGEVCVQVQGAGANPFDLKKIRGVFGSDESKLPAPIGGEAAGVVAAVGTEVEGISVGDEVIVYPAAGAFADRITVPAAAVRPRPDGLDVDHAAGLLSVGVTAADTVRTARVGQGDVVVIHGGAGGVGTIAVQLALRAGAVVIATASPRNHDYLAGLGALPVAYGEGLLDRIVAIAPDKVTAVIDTAGTDEAIDASLQLVAPDRIVSIAAFGRADDGIVLVNGGSEESKRNRREAIDGLIADAATGRLQTEVGEVFALADAAEALAALEQTRARGKIIVRP